LSKKGIGVVPSVGEKQKISIVQKVWQSMI